MLSLLTTAALLLARFAVAAPTSDTIDTTNIKAPNRICTEFCRNVHFKGSCKHLCTSPGICQTLHAPLRGEVSAVAPAQDASGCTFFAGAGCDGEKLSDITSPGIADLTKIGWSDRVQSWLCY